jgi:hypothetical protein
MALVHVYPAKDDCRHEIRFGGAGCWCEPKIKDEGEDAQGRPARVFIHQRLNKRSKAMLRATFFG